MISNYYENQVAWIRRFGGVCLNTPAEDVPIGFFQDSLNYELLSNGALAPRTGFDLYATGGTPDGRETQAIYPADFDGTIRLLIATDQNIYEYAPATDAWTHVYTIPSGSKRMTFAMLNNDSAPIVVFGNGGFTLKKWDGSTVSTCGGSPPTGRVVAYKNYLAVFDIANAPGKVQFAINNGDPDTWTIDGLERYVDITGKVTAVFPYSGLVIFTDTKTYLFSGDPDAPSGMSILSDSIGNVSHESAADCRGLLVWLSSGGIMGWAGGGEFPTLCLSDPPNLTLSRIQRDIDLTSWDEPNYVSAAFVSAENKYFISLKIDRTVGNVSVWRTFVYDIKFQVWFPWTLAASALVSYIPNDTRKQILLTGSTYGALRKKSTTTMTDTEISSANNNEYTYYVKSGDYDFELPNSEKIFRAVYFGTSGPVGTLPSGNKTIKIVFNGEFDLTPLDEISVTLSAGAFILDLSVLGDVLTDNPRFQEKRYPFSLRAKHFNFYISGKGTANAVIINSIGLEWKQWVSRKILVANITI